MIEHETAHPDHRRQLPRLRRIEGQIRGIAGMVEQRRYCVDILTQLQAARAALASVEREVLGDHADACIADAMLAGNQAEQTKKLGELTTLLKRALR